MDLKRESLETAAGDIEGAVLIAADVSKEADVEAYVAKTVKAFGRIDVFVNNAGINGDFKPIEEQSFENYSNVLLINVIGAAMGLKHVVKQMKVQGAGAIVNTASNGGCWERPV